MKECEKLEGRSRCEETGTNFRNRLGFCGLLRVVGSNTLCLHPLSLSIIIFVLTEEVNFVFVLVLGSRRRSVARPISERLPGFARSCQRSMLGRIRFDMGEPSRCMGICRRIRCRRESCEDVDISLRRGVSSNIR